MKKLRDRWRAYLRGWWAYYGLAEERRNIFDLEGWIRRHMRKCFWERWHDAAGRLRHLRQLGAEGRLLKVAFSSKGAWCIARTGALHTALSNRMLRRYRIPYAIRPCGPMKAAAFNRRMRKTARTVVWEGWRAQSRHLDPIPAG